MNTKTILFAALIAAMILPFGVMQSAEAISEPEGEHGTGTPDGTNQTGESDGTHGQDDVIPDGSNGPEVVITDGSNLPEGTIPDGSNTPVAPAPPIDQTEPEL